MSPRAESYTPSAIQHLSKEIIGSLDQQFLQAVQAKDYEKVVMLAEKLKDPLLAQKLDEAGQKAATVINSVLKEFGVEGEDIPFPFPEVGSAPVAQEKGQPVPQGDQDRRVGFEGYVENPLPVALLELVRKNRDGSLVCETIREAYITQLKDEYRDNPDAIELAKSNFSVQKATFQEKILTSGVATISQFASEKLKTEKRESWRAFYDYVAREYKGVGTLTFVRDVLFRFGRPDQFEKLVERLDIKEKK